MEKTPLCLSLHHTYLEVMGSNPDATYRLSYLTVLSSTHKPHQGNSQFELALWVLKNPTTSICNYSVSSALIVLRSFSVLGR